MRILELDSSLGQLPPSVKTRLSAFEESSTDFINYSSWEENERSEEVLNFFLNYV